MLEHLSLEQARLLTLPVVITAQAWRRTMQIEPSRSANELGARLSLTLHAAYKALLKYPSKRCVDFTLNQYSTGGGFGPQSWLDLKACRHEAPNQPPVLRISLCQEADQ